MEKFITYGSAEAIPYYNCSAKTPEEWLAAGVRRPFLGTFLLTFGIVAEITYFPVIHSMFKLKLVQHSCYKLIVFLAITDMFATVVSSFETGIFFIKGFVYCTSPNLIYISGSFGLGLWFMTCSNTLLLVFNRVCHLLSPEISAFLFGGFRVYIAFLISLSIELYITIFTAPPVFNSAVLAWIGDPLVTTEKTPEMINAYQNIPQATINWVYMFSICILYAIYYWKIVHMQDGQNSKASKQVFIQASLICFFNTATALVFNLLHFINPSPAIICFGEISWAMVHGMPAFIYLIMNKSIRKQIFKTLNTKKVSTVQLTLTSLKL